MHNTPPFYFDHQNVVNSAFNPSGISVANTASTSFFRRYLLQRAMSVFKWNLPEQWSRDYFLYSLYCYGTVAIVKTDKFGVIPQQCTLSGYNVFYEPRTVIISNPLLKGIKDPVIDSQCTLFKMTNDYGGIMDLVYTFADLMALTLSAAAGNMFNSKLAYVFAAENKAVAETFKEMSDQILSGKPSVIADKKMFNPDGTIKMQMFTQNLKQNFIAPDLLESLRNIQNMFDTEIGIPNTNAGKRERLIVDEVNANNVETFSRCDMWLDSWRESCRKTKKMFNIDVSVDWRVTPEELEVSENA